MSSDENVTAKAMRPPDPEQFLDGLREDLLRQAVQLENRSQDLHEEYTITCARAAGLRAAAGGLGEALEVIHGAHQQIAERQDAMVKDRKSGYDPRGHANRTP